MNQTSESISFKDSDYLRAFFLIDFFLVATFFFALAAMFFSHVTKHSRLTETLIHLLLLSSIFVNQYIGYSLKVLNCFLRQFFSFEKFYSTNLESPVFIYSLHLMSKKIFRRKYYLLNLVLTSNGKSRNRLFVGG